MSRIPKPQHFITNLINSISTSLPASQTTTNTLHDLSPAAKSQLLTLHVLFPNEFLPALDLLDRRLITQFKLASPNHPTTTTTQPPHQETIDKTPEEILPQNSTQPPTTNLYFVRSAQPARTTPRFHDALSAHYEVRPLAWNCSCPAFAFSAFPAGGEADFDSEEHESWSDLVQQQQEQQEEQGQGKWLFGGLARGMGTPVCKHLLACVLVERVRALSGCVEVREVSAEEIAGWCAGWGG